MAGKFFILNILLVFVITLSCNSSKKSNKVSQFSTFDSLRASFFEYKVAEIPVLQQQGLSNVVICKLYVLGGTQTYSVDEAGIEYLSILAAFESDSKQHKKEWLDAELQKLSSTIQVNSGFDFSVITLKTTQSNTEKALSILLERFFQPVFSPTKFNKVRDNYASSRMLIDNDPYTKLRTWSFSNYYQGTSYIIPPDGSYSTVFNFSHNGASLYYTQVLQKRRLKLLVVGKVGPEIIATQLGMYADQLPEGDYLRKNEYTQSYNKNQGNFQKDSIHNNIIRGIFLAPTAGKYETFSIQIAMSILSDRMNKELITKGYCQNIDAGYTEFKMPCCAIQMETQVPAAAFKSLMDLLDKTRREGFTQTELEQKKKIFLLKYYQDMQTNESRAEMIGNQWALGVWKQSLKFTENIESLHVNDVNICFQKYCKSIQWYFMGDVGKVGRGIFDRQFSN